MPLGVTYCAVFLDALTVIGIIPYYVITDDSRCLETAEIGSGPAVRETCVGGKTSNDFPQTGRQPECRAYSISHGKQTRRRQRRWRPSALHASDRGKEWIAVSTKLWTWGGTFFGYRDGDDLFIHGGKHAGRFRGDAVYDSSGWYLGEIKRGRLARSTSKSRSGPGFMPRVSRVGIVPSVDYVGNVMLAGYEDFPRPEEL